MVDFAEEGGVVTVLIEMLRQRQDVRKLGSEKRRIVPAVRGLGPAAREERASGGTANGDLAIGALEQRTLRRGLCPVNECGRRCSN